MPEPPHIMIGLMEEKFDHNAAAQIITLAAAAVAMMAAIGHNDAVILQRVLITTGNTFTAMDADAKEKLTVIAEEFVEAAKAGKHFMALAGFTDSV